MKEINYFLGYPDLKIVQNKDYFKFSLDSILLANFVNINPSYKNILDIGTGNAPILLVLSQKTTANLTGIEIQKESYDLAVETIKLNKLEDKITLINKDVKDYYRESESDLYDLVVCNPPYFKTENASHLNKNLNKTLARHEISLNIEDIFKITKKLLKNKGIISIIHRPERLVDIVTLMRQNNIEPKRIKFVYPKKGKESNMLLIEGMKNGKPGIKVLEPLYIYENNEYTKEVIKYIK